LTWDAPGARSVLSFFITSFRPPRPMHWMSGNWAGELPSRRSPPYVVDKEPEHATVPFPSRPVRAGGGGAAGAGWPFLQRVRQAGPEPADARAACHREE